MIQEDQNQMCDNSSYGDESNVVRSSTSSKKLKQTKVPQRGLGVAQLEKIRIEEQQKNDAKHSPPPPPLPPPPPPPPPPPLIPLSGPLLRTHSMPNIENFHTGSLPLLNPPTNGVVGGFSLGWPTIPFHGNGNLPKLWNNHELCNDKKLRDLSLPYETCSIAPVPNLLPKVHNYQHQQSSASLVNNVSSTTLLNSRCYSSMTSFLMEPPSNQNYVNNYLPSWPDDQKVMVGMKRSCPFSIDDPPIPKFRSTFAPITTPLIGPKESTSCQNGGTMLNLEPPIFRDFRSCPRVTHEATTNSRKNSNGCKSQTGNSNEELLTLAPTTITPSFHNSVSRHFKALPYQVSYDDPFVEARHGGSSQQPRCISLFPSMELQATSDSPPAPTSHNVCNGEVGENIDLNLRL